MICKLRLTQRQRSLLSTVLYNGHHKEKIALALCGTGQWGHATDQQQLVYCINKIITIGEDLTLADFLCLSRTPSGSFLDILTEASRKHQTIMLIRSDYPGRDATFNNNLNTEFFSNVIKWLDDDVPGISAILFPNGQLTALTVDEAGTCQEISSISITGSDIQLYYPECTENLPEYSIRTAQTFGQGTTNILSRLSIGIVGVSGTGSPVAEMLYRLGVGELVLVDGDIMKIENIGRIYNSTMDDVRKARYKVDVLADAILKSGLPTLVTPVPKDLFHPDVVRRLALCDVLIGCMDSVDGRDLLNRLSSFYLIPYFDLGVYLDADGQGGVNQVCGTVHYLHPDGSSLFSRGVYTEDELRASALFRTDKEQYKEQVQSKYIRGVNEEKPAVISVNTLIASLAINEFLARLHPFRDDPNEDFESLGISLTQNRLIFNEETDPCPILAKYVGRGDIRPLLDMPALSERRD
jgi:hypothetical protein